MAKLLDVSIGPLREAIQQLMWEELVHVHPQRGIQIAQTNIKQVREAFQLRKILEKEAVRDRKSTRLNSSHIPLSRMPSSA